MGGGYFFALLFDAGAISPYFYIYRSRATVYAVFVARDLLELGVARNLA